jgi:hypothetical protein
VVPLFGNGWCFMTALFENVDLGEHEQDEGRDCWEEDYGFLLARCCLFHQHSAFVRHLRLGQSEFGSYRVHSSPSTI